MISRESHAILHYMLQILTRTNVILAAQGLDDHEIVVRLTADEGNYFPLQTIHTSSRVHPDPSQQVPAASTQQVPATPTQKIPAASTQ